jgi:hypothetical protein
MVELARLRQVGDVLTLEDHHTVINGKNDVTTLGFWVDAAEREHAERCGAKQSFKYAPYDYTLNDRFYEIKTTTGESVSLSDDEDLLASKEMLAGRDYFIAVFTQPDANGAYTFIGYVSYRSMPPTIRSSKDGWFWTLKQVKRNLL